MMNLSRVLGVESENNVDVDSSDLHDYFWALVRCLLLTRACGVVC